MALMSFSDVVAHLQKQRRQMSLLLGNGFSMSYDKDIFSYNALYTFLSARGDELLDKLFGAIKTKNFELVMQQLDTTIGLLEAFNASSDLVGQIRIAQERLKAGLLNSVHELHPEHVYKIPVKRGEVCAQFLRLFIEGGGHIFTANYDLLLYWVLMSQGVTNQKDGFGRELLNPVEVERGEDGEWSDLLWGPNQESQNIHYLHGALHLFDSGSEIIKEQYDSNGYLLQNISNRMNDGSYPIFVTAGSGEEKLNHIRHNRYLSYCYDRLCEIDGSLVTFGFNFGSQDEHIVDALNKAAKFGSRQPPKLWSIYIGVYSTEDIAHIAKIEEKFHAKVRIFDAKTVDVWGIEKSKVKQ